MRPDQTDIEIIRNAWIKMATKKDFLDLLNLAKPMIYGDKAHPFEIRQISWYSGSWSAHERYHRFTIKKKSGGERTINAPVNGLKALQRTIAFILQCIFEPHEAAKGFVRGRSIVDNARHHEGSRYVYNIDLKDFFPGIEQARIWKCLQLKPFCLLDQSELCATERLRIAGMIANICCSEMEFERTYTDGQLITAKRNVLPQGAPTSPVLTNIVCQKLDNRLSGVANRFGLKYSRYADDITFSSMHNIYHENGEFITELRRIITEQGFILNEKKTRLQKEGYRKEVTGLLVNEKVNVQKRYIKQIRMWLYYWERYGKLAATKLFMKDYNKDKCHVKMNVPEMEHVIWGKLQFLKMIKGATDDSYINLLNRFNMLKSNLQAISDDYPTKNFDAPKPEKTLIVENSQQEDILEEIFNKGLDAAMMKYQNSH